MPDYLSACCLVGHEGWDFINAKVIQGRTFQRCEEEKIKYGGGWKRI